jgi:hypothetical protein
MNKLTIVNGENIVSFESEELLDHAIVNEKLHIVFKQSRRIIAIFRNWDYFLDDSKLSETTKMIALEWSK